MRSEDKDAKRFRTKAEEVRQNAKSLDDPDIRAAFLKIAEEYEHLARQAERLARRTK